MTAACTNQRSQSVSVFVIPWIDKANLNVTALKAFLPHKPHGKRRIAVCCPHRRNSPVSSVA